MGSLEVAEATEVLEPGRRTLHELAETANREHELCEQHLLSALPHAIRAGHALIEAHGQVQRGDWEPWLADNFNGSALLARLYVRLSYYEDEVEGQRSIKSAREAITGLPPVWLPGTRVTRYDDPVRVRAIELVKSGKSHREVAELLGVGRGAIQHWVNPARAKRQSMRQSARRRAMREQAKGDAVRQAVRKAGAATAEAWQMAERMQDVLAQAHRETEDREARAALSRAGVHYRKMRDEIVRALGVS